MNLNNQLVFVDHTAGAVYAVPAPSSGAVLASPSPLPVPSATIHITGVQAFVPGVSTVVFAVTSNVAGREGATYNWCVAA